MMFRRHRSALRLTILVVMIHLLAVIALPIFLSAFFGKKLPGSTPIALAAIIPVLYIGYRLVKNHRLDGASLFVLPLIAINLVFHEAKGQPLMTPLLLGGVGLALVNALLLRKLLTSQAWAATPTPQKSPPLDAVVRHKLSRMPGVRLLHLFPFLIDVLALTLFLVALGQVIFVSFLSGLSMSSLLFFQHVLTWGVFAIAVLLLIGYGVWHRMRLHSRIRSGPSAASPPPQRLPQGEENMQESDCKSTIV